MIITDKKLPKRRDHDEYPTPKPLIHAVYKHLFDEIKENIYDVRDFPNSKVNVLDAGAGTGNWGNLFYRIFYDELPPLEITGVEIQDKPRPEKYHRWFPSTDFGKYYDGKNYDELNYYHISVGNPPYKLAHDFLDNMFLGVKENGLIVLLLKTAFIESKVRYENYFSDPFRRPYKVIQSVRRVSFDYDINGSKGSNEVSYAIFVWRVGYGVRYTKLDWLDWDYEEKR